MSRQKAILRTLQKGEHFGEGGLLAVAADGGGRLDLPGRYLSSCFTPSCPPVTLDGKKRRSAGGVQRTHGHVHGRNGRGLRNTDTRGLFALYRAARGAGYVAGVARRAWDRRAWPLCAGLTLLRAHAMPGPLSYTDAGTGPMSLQPVAHLAAVGRSLSLSDLQTQA